MESLNDALEFWALEKNAGMVEHLKLVRLLS